MGCWLVPLDDSWNALVISPLAYCNSSSHLFENSLKSTLVVYKKHKTIIFAYILRSNEPRHLTHLSLVILLLSPHSLDRTPYVAILIRLFPHLPVHLLLHPPDPLPDITDLLVHSLLAGAHDLVDPPVEIDLRESQGHLSCHTLLHQV
jgi:hypothetical protein